MSNVSMIDLSGYSATRQIEEARRRMEAAARGERLIFNLGKDIPPDAVFDVLQGVVQNYRVKLQVRHATLGQYFDGAVSGAMTGAVVAAGGRGLFELGKAALTGDWSGVMDTTRDAVYTTLLEPMMDSAVTGALVGAFTGAAGVTAQLQVYEGSDGGIELAFEPGVRALALTS